MDFTNKSIRTPPRLLLMHTTGLRVYCFALPVYCHFAELSFLLAITSLLFYALSETSAQVLTPLSWPDLLWVAALPGVSEELLFRGALIPALFPDWCDPLHLCL